MGQALRPFVYSSKLAWQKRKKERFIHGVVVCQLIWDNTLCCCKCFYTVNIHFLEPEAITGYSLMFSKGPTIKMIREIYWWERKKTFSPWTCFWAEILLHIVCWIIHGYGTIGSFLLCKDFKTNPQLGIECLYFHFRLHRLFKDYREHGHTPKPCLNLQVLLYICVVQDVKVVWWRPDWTYDIPLIFGFNELL